MSPDDLAVEAPREPNLESAVVSRLMWRLMPFLFLLYIVAYLDRINVSFAILMMRGELHLSDRAFGDAAGVFFLGYLLFQLPSNLVLQLAGVRRWICVLMVTWGLVSCSMVFIRGPRSFYILRFLLGAAEAGFFPGVVFYMRRWFPAHARARAVAWFMTANPLAGVVGSPISGMLLGLRGAGLAGWQWLFLLEGLPAILLGVVVLWVLTDKPEQARWLTDNQREWLVAALESEKHQSLPTQRLAFVSLARASARILSLSAVYFALPACMYGMTFWLPTAIQSLSQLSYFMISVVAVIPYLATAVAMVLVGVRSDRTGERRWHTAVPAFFGAASLCLAAYGGASWLVIAGMSLGMVGAQSMAGPFWAMATSRTSGTAAAASIAIINSLGNLGGFFGPYIIGLVRSPDGGFRGGLLAIGATMVVSGGIAVAVGSPPRYRQANQGA
jgi:ACS family tartrate transporter-like MFS transporter